MQWKTILFAVVASSASLVHAGDSGSPDPLRFPDMGPIRVREQFLIGTGYLAFDPGSAEVLDRGTTRFDVAHSRTNTFARSHSVIRLLESRSERADVAAADLRGASAEGAAFLIDGELRRTSIAVRRGFGRGLEASVTVPVVGFGGGGLDEVIEGFHSAFGLGQGGRTGAGRNDLLVYLRDGSGREISPKIATGSALGDIAFAVKKEIPIGGRDWTVSVEGLLELPTGSEEHLASGGGVDVGTQLLFTRNFRSGCLHGAVGIVRTAESTVFGTDSQFLGTVMLGWEEMISMRTSAVAQITASQSPFRQLDVRGLTADAYLFNLGLKHRVASGAVVFAAISENLLHYDSSADIGLHVGITLTR